MAGALVSCGQAQPALEVLDCANRFDGGCAIGVCGEFESLILGQVLIVSGDDERPNGICHEVAAARIYGEEPQCGPTWMAAPKGGDALAHHARGCERTGGIPRYTQGRAQRFRRGL